MNIFKRKIKSIPKTKSIELVAQAYDVSVEELSKQLMRNHKLRTELLRYNFDGNLFYPAHQQILMRFLGNPKSTLIEL